MFRKGSFSHLLKDHRLELTLLKSEQALNEARRGIVFHGSCLLSCLFSGDELSATGLAARYGQTAALQLLLQHGARPYGTEMAIIHNHLDCLQLLHAAGADLHEGEYTTDGVFYPATCNARSEEVLRFLIDHGVSPAIPFDNNINHRCSDVPSAERYLNMYRNTGVWTPQQIEEFRRTSPLYRTVAPSPAPQ